MDSGSGGYGGGDRKPAAKNGAPKGGFDKPIDDEIPF
jgi:hypothetical protein